MLDNDYIPDRQEQFIEKNSQQNQVGRLNSGEMARAVFLLLCFLCVIAGNSLVYAGTVDLPQTGQTRSYHAGDDADIGAGVIWPAQRFTNGTGADEADCLVDNLTGLMWPMNGNLAGGTKTWTKALDYVAAINSGAGLCGHTDWRLPNVNEMESLVNAGQANTAAWLNTQGFVNAQASYYWSSSTSANNSGYAWIVCMSSGWDVYMWSGSVSDRNKSYRNYVWPVRSGQ